MRVTVIGCGYVGLVQAAGLALLRHSVTAVDIDEKKIARLKAGEVPFFEKGLTGRIRQGVDDGRLRFTTDVHAAVASADVVFLCVGTPSRPDGSANLGALYQAAAAAAPALSPGAVVAVKSTVPPGSVDRVGKVLAEGAKGHFSVCANPEFLREGQALEDFFTPDRVVIGAEDPHAVERLRELYAPLGQPIVVMDTRSAEITKYAANAYLAMRLSFINEMALLADAVHANIDAIREGIGLDARIGQHFFQPGPGYGGSCFPKDLPALVEAGSEAGVDLFLVRAAHDRNELQKEVLVGKVARHFGPRLHGLQVCLWGLAFKAGTDDLRESPALRTIDGLLEAGAKVSAYDPEARENARALFGDRVTVCSSALEAAHGASALLLLTDWPEFREVPLAALRQALQEPVVFDGRNAFDAALFCANGFTYYGIGRGRRS